MLLTLTPCLYQVALAAEELSVPALRTAGVEASPALFLATMSACSQQGAQPKARPRPAECLRALLVFDGAKVRLLSATAAAPSLPQWGAPPAAADAEPAAAADLEGTACSLSQEHLEAGQWQVIPSDGGPPLLLAARRLRVLQPPPPSAA